MPALFLTVFLVMGSFALLLPSVMYVLANMGVSPSLSTPVLAGYSIAQFIAGPVWGRVSDRTGRKPLLLISLALGALSYAGMALFADSVLTIVLGYVLAGTCAGNSAILYAGVADLTNTDNRSKGMGLIGAGIGLAFTLGPAIGSFLGGKSAVSAGISLPATASAVACFIAFLIVAFLFRESLPEESRRAKSEPTLGRFEAIRHLALRPVLFQMCWLMFVFTMALAMMEPVMPLLTKVRYDWGPREMGMAFTVVGLTLVVVQGGLIGRLAARFGEKALARFGLTFMAVGLLILVYTPVEAGIFLGLMVTSISVALYNTSMLSLASHRSAEHERGLVMGVFQSMQALGRSMGPLCAGFLFQEFVGLPMLAGAVAAGLSLFWLAHIYRRMERQGGKGA